MCNEMGIVESKHNIIIIIKIKWNYRNLLIVYCAFPLLNRDNLLPSFFICYFYWISGS